jgi:RNA ligase (TIGR02306 family)
MRKMATIRRIDDINPIEGADAIEVATVGGWKVVIKKGEFAVGDLAVYCEIDSWIPIEVAPFLQKGDRAYEFEGVTGNRLRTVRLRGQISQGLLLPIAVAPGSEVGADVSDILNIKKYEAPVPAQLAGDVNGTFPGFIPKTDQERIQNLGTELAEWKTKNLTWEVTEKLDGSSMTVFFRDGEFGVCSRNYDLKRSESNSLWKTALSENMEVKMRALGKNIAIQGELIGEGIQGNPYKIRGQQFYVYDVYDIDAGRYYNANLRQKLVAELGLKHCPVMNAEYRLGNDTIDTLLAQAEAKTVMLDNGPEREGLVFKCIEIEASFKAISNKFLLKTGG